jgi:hypothetical protein
MRIITDHVVRGDAAPQLAITALDEPGSGDACHSYSIVNANFMETSDTVDCHIYFQNGPIKEAGVNGVTNEALLAIVIDRLRSFQAGPYSSMLNGEALKHCRAALLALQMRTHERIKRGVEGTSVR